MIVPASIAKWCIATNCIWWYEININDWSTTDRNLMFFSGALKVEGDVNHGLIWHLSSVSLHCLLLVEVALTDTSPLVFYTTSHYLCLSRLTDGQSSGSGCCYGTKSVLTKFICGARTLHSYHTVCTRTESGTFNISITRLWALLGLP